MAGYVIVNDEITDPARFEEFRSRVGATVAAHGGKYHVRGGAIEVVDGDWTPERVVVIEFESVERAKAWLSSPEYSEIRKIRLESARANVTIAEGV